MVNEITGQVGSTQVFLAEKSGEMVQHLGKAKDSAERLINLIQKFKL